MLTPSPPPDDHRAATEVPRNLGHPREKTRRPSAATIRTVAEALVAGDFYPEEAVAAFAWPLLLQAGGLARLEGPRLTLTPKGRKAMGNPGTR